MTNNAPVFSLVYTSVRPQVIPQVFKLWNERSTLKTHEWCLGIDAGDTASLAACQAIAEQAKAPDAGCSAVKVAINEGPKTCVAGWNIAANVSKGKVMIAVADDFLPPVGWDSLLLSLEPKGWEDGEYVVKVEDGYVHDIFVLSILTRKRYERFGYLFYPKYPSMFNDTEFGDVALRDGVVIEANHLLFEHLHPDCGKRQRDGVDLVHASKDRWNTGEQLYNFRKKQCFPIDDGPLAAKYAAQPVEKQDHRNDRYVAYMQVMKDDLCLLDVCTRLVEEGVHDFCFCQPDRYWSGEPSEPENDAAISAVIAALTNSGQTVHHKKFSVDACQVAGDSRILVETRVRNESLNWVRSLGYRHVLVVDGDELWVKGTLNIVKAYVEQGHPAISVRLIPVIGLPGYPVEGASDVAVVYVASDVIFKVCRSPYVKQTIIQRPLIYHFTGTRKDMVETIKKHRRGGHYDDKDYLVEEWLDKCLPNIAPGFQHKWPSGHVGAHFFGPYQIWPVIREWRPGDLASLPETLRPYLPQALP